MGEYHPFDNMPSQSESKNQVIAHSPGENPMLRSPPSDRPAQSPAKKRGRPTRTDADREVVKQFGKHLRWARAALDLNQRQAAEMCGVDMSTWSFYEAGKRLPDFARLPTICGRLNVDMDFLFFGSLDGVSRPMSNVLAAMHPELVGIDRTAPDKPRRCKT